MMVQVTFNTRFSSFEQKRRIVKYSDIIEILRSLGLCYVTLHESPGLTQGPKHYNILPWPPVFCKSWQQFSFRHFQGYIKVGMTDSIIRSLYAGWRNLKGTVHRSYMGVHGTVSG